MSPRSRLKLSLNSSFKCAPSSLEALSTLPHTPSRRKLNTPLIEEAKNNRALRLMEQAAVVIQSSGRSWKARKMVGQRRADRAMQDRIKSEAGYGEARTVLAIEAASELLAAVARLKAGRLSISSLRCPLYPAVDTTPWQVGESARRADNDGLPVACILRRAGHYLVMHDSEKLRDRKVDFDKARLARDVPLWRSSFSSPSHCCYSLSSLSRLTISSPFVFPQLLHPRSPPAGPGALQPISSRRRHRGRG